MKYILAYWYICNTCLSLNLSQAFMRPIFLSVLLLRMVVFLIGGLHFFLQRSQQVHYYIFIWILGIGTGKCIIALEFLIFWLVDKIVINYTCPVDKFIMLLVKMGFLGILAQRRRHLKVFTQDVNVYTKRKSHLITGKHTRTWGAHVLKSCENIFLYQGLWVTNM